VILSDGMGGMAGGEEAASLTVAAFASYLSLVDVNGGLMKMSGEAAEYANRCVFARLNGKGGATLSAIIFGSRGGVAVNVGDSRICFIDDKHSITQITKDDTIQGQVGKDYEEDDIWLHYSRMDNRLAQHIGMGQGLLPHTFDLTKYNSPSNNKSIFLVTSDGAHYIGKKMIQKISEHSINANDIASRIVSVSEYLSGHDNMSVITVPNNIVTSGKVEKNFVEVILHTINDRNTNILTQLTQFDKSIQQHPPIEKAPQKESNEVKVPSNHKKNSTQKKRPVGKKRQKGSDVAEGSKYKVDIIKMDDDTK
jgi:serine/threonine protein phosphatase PrpC